MSFFEINPRQLRMSGGYNDPLLRGRVEIGSNGIPHTLERLSTDKLGQTSLVVTGILPNSEVRFFVNDIGEVAGGVESATSPNLTFNIDYYPTPKQGFLVILLPGYHPLRVPMQVTRSSLSYTVFQTVDPSYLT